MINELFNQKIFEIDEKRAKLDKMLKDIKEQNSSHLKIEKSRVRTEVERLKDQEIKNLIRENKNLKEQIFSLVEKGRKEENQEAQSAIVWYVRLYNKYIKIFIETLGSLMTLRTKNRSTTRGSSSRGRRMTCWNPLKLPLSLVREPTATRA